MKKQNPWTDIGQNLSKLPFTEQAYGFIVNMLEIPFESKDSSLGLTALMKPSNFTKYCQQ